MIETFTKQSPITSNGIEMERHNHNEHLGDDELSFYNSLTGKLDSIQCQPKAQTLQNILNYSENFNSVK
ncbi:hypothetical protein KXQ82_04020 [Mucilaginibacter sp. HMF5004]|uniref:hypothetical protein n=1 Tax=Mucilaginibacter rivuli TaxID=2857527 RepID=UPI001C601AD6|nr:hypothetical protein [Mucilaginibacter rivuli]MBW4888862.1 hypothetical protein [Mucilaginibacter rivuli]